MHCRGNPFKFYDPNMSSGESAIWVFAVWRCAIMLNVSNWEEYVCESNRIAYIWMLRTTAFIMHFRSRVKEFSVVIFIIMCIYYMNCYFKFTHHSECRCRCDDSSFNCLMSLCLIIFIQWFFVFSCAYQCVVVIISQILIGIFCVKPIWIIHRFNSFENTMGMNCLMWFELLNLMTFLINFNN